MPPLLDSEKDLHLHLFAGLEVVKTQQTEINRRIGRLEKIIEDKIVDPSRVSELEEWRENMATSKKDWWTWGAQLVGSALIISILSWVAAKMGVELKWL